MKVYYPLLLLMLTFVGCSLRAQMPSNKNISFTISLDSALASYEQWVYMWHYEGNDFTVDDSTFVKKGQKEITLYAYADEERWFNFLFSKKGPIDWYTILGPNTVANVALSITDSAINPSKKIEGASAHNENLCNVQRKYELNSQMRDLAAQLSVPALSANKKDSIQHAIESLGQQLDAISLETVLHSPSTYNTYGSLMKLKSKISRDSLVTLCRIAQKRFPADKKIERLLHNQRTVASPESEQSKALAARMNKIKQRRLNEELMSGEPSVPSQQTKVKDIGKISLKSDNGKQVVVGELKGEYVLIDFWASWCIPCLEGLPYIRQAKEICGDKLTVCMISMDKNLNTWKENIKKQKLDAFINLNVYDESGKMNEGVQALGIDAIPYNVLLDSQHRIVATDLHKKALLDKLYEWMK